jgi:hypothetical protein
MPPHRPKHHHEHEHHPPPLVPTSAIRKLLSPDRLDPLLAPFIPDSADRAFVSRCILEQGPIHHRGANFALLALVATLLERTGGVPDKPPAGETIAVPLRLPPHLAPEHDEDNAYPLHMPLAPLEVVAPKDSPAFSAIVDCLLDGPPHHALANAALVCALGLLLERFPARSQEDKP